MGKNDSFFNLKIPMDCQIENPYLNSSVCLLVFSVVRAMELKLNGIALNRSRNHIEDM